MMRKLSLLLVFAVLTLGAFGQVKDYYNPLNSTKVPRLIAEKTLFYPTGCGAPSGTGSLNSDTTNRAAIYRDSCGHRTYLYDPSSKTWSIVVTGAVTSYDSAYARRLLSLGFTGGTLTAILGSGQRLDVSLDSRYNKISDTASMLSNLYRKTDTANQLSGYQRKNFALLLQDTATAFSVRPLNNRFLDSVSTIRALANSKYSAGTVTSVATTDGVGIISVVANPATTPNITHRVDTVNISTRAWRQKGTDSMVGLVNLKMNISDTANMLVNRLKTSDTTTQLSGYVRKGFPVLYTDTAAMHTNLLRKTDTAYMLSNRLKISDTALMVSARPLNNRFLDSVSTIRALANSKAASGTVTSVSVTAANGISGSVATATTTPAITLSLGAITPTSVSSSGAITGTTLAGIIVTPAQPNITSLGTLSGLTVTATINGSVTGNAVTSTQAAISDDAAPTGNVFLTWVNTASGTRPLTTTSTKLYFVPATGSLTATGGFVGNITGNASTATAASTLDVTDNTTSNGAYSLVWATGAGTGKSMFVSSTKLNWNPSTGNLGIGIGAPLNKLHIASATTTDGLQLTRANGTFGFRYTRTGAIEGTLADGVTFQTVIQLPEGNASASQHLVLQPTAGNVGISTTTPQKKFVVSNNGGAGIEFDPVAGAGGGTDILSYNRTTSAYAPVTINASTFSIGTNGGTTALTINASQQSLFSGRVGVGNGLSSGYFSVTAATSGVSASFSDNINNTLQIFHSSAGARIDANTSLILATGATPTTALTINSSQVVTVSGTQIINYTYSAGAIGFRVQDNNGTGIYVSSQNTLNFNYGINATSDGYINNTGYNNGTTQFRNLHVTNGKGDDIVYFNGTNKESIFYGTIKTPFLFVINAASAQTGSDGYGFFSSGAAFSNLATNGAYLSLIDNAYNGWIIQPNTSKDLIFYGETTGTVVSKSSIDHTTGAFSALSDSAYKKNIVPAKDGALALLSQIKIRSYSWKSTGTLEPYGVVAQELYKVLPAYVNKPDDSDRPWMVSKSEMVPFLLKVQQELLDKVTDLEKRISKLENK